MHQPTTKNCVSSVLFLQLSLLILTFLSDNKNLNVQATASSSGSGIHFDADSNSYSGLTFTFDPRLDKRVEWLHFEHWLSVMQQSSALLYESLNGRAHLAEVRVLIPYKWRQLEWPHKPGGPIIMNRRLKFADSDVIVGFEDPIYKETPFAVQHDECSRQGLNIHMPISFLEQNQALDPKLKARQFVREFASHRYGIFKESGFRSDVMYPLFASLAGYKANEANNGYRTSLAGQQTKVNLPPAALNRTNQPHQQQQHLSLIVDNSQTIASNVSQTGDSLTIRGFDENWNECTFDTSTSTGLPFLRSFNCAPYLAKFGNQTPTTNLTGEQQQQKQNPLPPTSFNLMSVDPFIYSGSSARVSAGALLANSVQPLEWRDLADSAKWHFCGDNFVPNGGGIEVQTNNNNIQQQFNSVSSVISVEQLKQPVVRPQIFAHNQLAANKQNVMCKERSALDVIKASEDFRRTPFSPSTFNRLPSPTFKFLQEMPPRLILCVEFTGHLYQSHRFEHGILESAIAKFLAFDLVDNSEVATVLFGQKQASNIAFERLDSSVKNRLLHYSPAVHPYDEPAILYTEQELNQLGIRNQVSRQAKLVKGSCSFEVLLLEALSLLRKHEIQYDDIGADIVVITSGLFIEDETKIEELLKSHYKQEQLQLNIIIYPSSILFDTKSRDGFIVLNPLESEAIVSSRINKLLLIQRLTNAKIHLVKEHLDANGDVKMSTLIQFYQIFEHISRGHSWDQTNSLISLGQEALETKKPKENKENKLCFKFKLDNSMRNELIVGFIEPRQQGKRLSSIKNLKLRAPEHHLIFTDTNPYLNESVLQEQSLLAASASLRDTIQADEPIVILNEKDSTSGSDLPLTAPTGGGNSIPPGAHLESTLIPYRTLLGFAGFHLKASHLAYLKNSYNLSGTWTLTATSDEPIQTSAIALARVNPSGNSITANCWVQTYYSSTNEENLSETDDQFSGDSFVRQLKMVKVFAQTKAGAQFGPVQGVIARMEVRDEMGNIVQNVNMVDDGLGAPDMTRADGIYSQYIQRTYRAGYYKVNVELTGANCKRQQQPTSKTLNGSIALSKSKLLFQQTTTSGHDNPCCGNYIQPSSAKNHQIDTTHLSRQLYCGTFYVEANNKLAQQKPPRVNTLRVGDVDQENRRVKIRWYEPSVDILTNNVFDSASLTSNNGAQQVDDPSVADSEQQLSNSDKGQQLKQEDDSATSENGQQDEPNDDKSDSTDESTSSAQTTVANSYDKKRRIIRQSTATTNSQTEQEPLNSRYEIKLFSDRDAIKRAFDGKHEVGFKFNEWSVEGAFPNASAYGGKKEVTLRIPFKREGIYYIAMRVYNNLGVGSELSNIIQFWMKNNLTSQEVDAIYGQANTVDSEGNIYDNNGELIQRADKIKPLNRGIGLLDGTSVFIIISIAAFILAIVCIALVVCLMSSARKSLKGGSHSDDDDEEKNSSSAAAIIGIRSGSSMVSSGCESSQRSEVASSTCGSPGGHDTETNELNDGTTDYSNQIRISHQHLISTSPNCQQFVGNLSYSHHQRQQDTNDCYQSHSNFLDGINTSHQLMTDNLKAATSESQWCPGHTIVNGVSYATVQNNRIGLPPPPASPPSEASHLNHQLQQQLNSVLKQRQFDELRSSPALESVRERHDDDDDNNNHTYGPLHSFEVHIPPSPYNAYYDNALQQQQPQIGLPIRDASIYSQVTNLQQVNSAVAGGPTVDRLCAYHANQHCNQWPVTSVSSPTYSTQIDDNSHQQEEISNSAVSEV